MKEEEEKEEEEKEEEEVEKVEEEEKEEKAYTPKAFTVELRFFLKEKKWLDLKLIEITEYKKSWKT